MSGPPDMNPRGAADMNPREEPVLSGYTVAVLGLGMMGTGMAERLCATGATVRIYNRTRSRAQELAAHTDAIAAATPREATEGADFAVISVSDEDALRSIVAGPDGVATAAEPPQGRLVLNTSTVNPEGLYELSLANRSLLDVAILGNQKHAKTGLLRCYVGGPTELVAQSQPLLDALAREVKHLGEVGAGMRMKLVMNLLMGLEVQALAEAVSVGEHSGLDRATVLDAINGSGFSSAVMAFKAKRIGTNDYEYPDFRLQHMRKDLSLAVDRAQKAGMRLPVSEAALYTHVRAIEAGLGHLDCAAIATMVSAIRVVEGEDDDSYPYGPKRRTAPAREASI